MLYWIQDAPRAASNYSKLAACSYAVVSVRYIHIKSVLSCDLCGLGILREGFNIRKLCELNAGGAMCQYMALVSTACEVYCSLMSDSLKSDLQVATSGNRAILFPSNLFFENIFHSYFTRIVFNPGLLIKIPIKSYLFPIYSDTFCIILYIYHNT